MDGWHFWGEMAWLSFWGFVQYAKISDLGDKLNDCQQRLLDIERKQESLAISLLDHLSREIRDAGKSNRPWSQ
jgi:hypothetical protein